MRKRNVSVGMVLASVVFALAVIGCADEKRVDVPDHPFQLPPDLKLQDLIASGYAFNSAPCGFVTYAKTIADTTFFFGIDIDCLEEQENDDGLDYDIDNPLGSYDDWEDEKANPCYPWSCDETVGCNHHINMKGVTFTMEGVIDTAYVLQYVYRYGGTIVDSASLPENGIYTIAYPIQTGPIYCRLDLDEVSGWSQGKDEVDTLYKITISWALD